MNILVSAQAETSHFATKLHPHLQAIICLLRLNL